MTDEKYRECLRKLRSGWQSPPVPYKTRAELEEELEGKIATGEISSSEAEDIWQDWMHKDERWNEW